MNEDLPNKEEKAKARIRIALNKHGKGIMWFSGGEDSVVLFHLFTVNERRMKEQPIYSVVKFMEILSHAPLFIAGLPMT